MSLGQVTASCWYAAGMLLAQLQAAPECRPRQRAVFRCDAVPEVTEQLGDDLSVG